jgi:hypothetical protein
MKLPAHMCQHICQSPTPACSTAASASLVLLPQALVDMDSAFAALDVTSQQEQQPPAEPPERPPDADAHADDVVFTGQPFSYLQQGLLKVEE